jgi:EAL domain-containing protein (putative c-di-GMP-specific phosphodiesterase class I)
VNVSPVQLAQPGLLDVVKIDRSFVEKMARDVQDAVLVRLVIDTAHT